MTGTIQAPLLVLGGAGIVGAGVVDAAVEAGWPVIAVDRDVDGLERLRVRHADADLTLLP
jgi:nucleoside-diphosphate-sugar epimerase